MAKNDDVVFRRINGRVVPIKKKKSGSSSSRSRKKDDEGKLSKGAKAAVSAQASYVGGVKAKEMFTGRTTLFHGTSSKAYKNIINEGLKPGKGGITNVLFDQGELDNADDLVYADRRKAFARVYAAQASGLEDAHRQGGNAPREWLRSQKRLKDNQRALRGRYRGKVAKISVPLWDEPYKSKLTKNPEIKYQVSKGANSKAAHRAFDVPTFKGGLGPEVFKDSPNYRKYSGNEFMRYAKKHRGRVGAGLALGAASIGAAAYGAKKAAELFGVGSD